jgi:hypothetical protein
MPELRCGREELGPPEKVRYHVPHAPALAIGRSVPVLWAEGTQFSEQGAVLRLADGPLLDRSQPSNDAGFERCRAQDRSVTVGCRVAFQAPIPPDTFTALG